VERWVSG